MPGSLGTSSINQAAPAPKKTILPTMLVLPITAGVLTTKNHWISGILAGAILATLAILIFSVAAPRTQVSSRSIIFPLQILITRTIIYASEFS